jgi:hypothetical protein
VSAGERSNWRDARISLRHRKWGFHCPGTDLDFMLIEFNWGLPVAVIDYKHHSKSDPFEGMTKWALQAMGGLYNRNRKNLPFIVCRYWPDDVETGTHWCFEALPINDAARPLFKTPDRWTPYSEEQWVNALLTVRGTPDHERGKGRTVRLCTVLPPEHERLGRTRLSPLDAASEGAA